MMNCVLHYIQPKSDLSFVAQKDCGHVQVDVDICTPFEQLPNLSAYILVALLLMALWHSSDAERMLRQSGRFDYSSLSHDDMRYYMWKGSLTRERLLCILEGVVFRCECEHSFIASDSASALFEKHSPLPHVVLGEFPNINWTFTMLNGKISRLFYWKSNWKSCELYFPSFTEMSRFLSEFTCLLLSGADTRTQLMHSETGMRWSLKTWKTCPMAERCALATALTS